MSSSHRYNPPVSGIGSTNKKFKIQNLNDALSERVGGKASAGMDDAAYGLMYLCMFVYMYVSAYLCINVATYLCMLCVYVCG